MEVVISAEGGLQPIYIEGVSEEMRKKRVR
jgi:hypothetical protein